MGQVAGRTQKPEKEETKKEGYWGNKDSQRPLNVLGKTECSVYAQDGMHTQRRPELSLGFISVVTLWVPHKEKVIAKAELWLSTERVSPLTAKL